MSDKKGTDRANNGYQPHKTRIETDKSPGTAGYKPLKGDSSEGKPPKKP